MNWEARIGSDLSVYCDGSLLPPPPTKITAVLLIALLDRPEIWFSRKTVAGQLYPEQPEEKGRVALRQTVLRLKQWLGPNAIEVTSTHIRVAPNWRIEFISGNERLPIEHDWLREIFGARRTPPEAWPHREFYNLIRYSAAIDRKEASHLLVGGDGIFIQLNAKDARELLALTRPIDKFDVRSALYTLVEAHEAYLSCQFVKSMELTEIAFQKAVSDGQRADTAKVVAMGLFNTAEAGDLEAFTVWQLRASTAGRENLTLRNALAALAWNQGDFKRAIRRYLAFEDQALVGTRHERIHYWSNLFILSAEMGRVELAEEAKQRCEEEFIPSQDFRWTNSMQVGYARLAIAKRDYVSAIKYLENLDPHGWDAWELYRNEGLALAYAESGQKAEAQQALNTCLNLLKASGSPLNPRRANSLNRAKELIS